METIPLICRANQWTWFLYDRNLRHERVKRCYALLLENLFRSSLTRSSSERPHRIAFLKIIAIWSPFYVELQVTGLQLY